MNQNLKNILGAVSALVILAIGYAALSYVNFYGQAIQPSSFRSFSVTGEGKTTTKPDVAEFNFQVITEGGTDIASLQNKNTETMNKAIAFIKAQGVAEKDIKTEYYNLEPRYQSYDCKIVNVPLAPTAANSGFVTSSQTQTCPPPSIVGYTINQSINIKIRDFTKIGDLMGGVVKNGANQVGSLSFTIDDPSQSQDQARAEAIAKAKTKAESIAKAGGFKIGRLLGIQEGSQYPVYNESITMGATAKLDAAAPAPTIQPGSQEVNVSVTLQYEIK